MEWKQLLSDKRYGHVSSKKTSDLRTEFQRDYHRIIGSASFRRLQDKTQVFPLDRGDFVRTRLTHSLEVSSFAKSLGQMCFAYIMQNNLDENIDESIKADICNILECAGLLHDIGNPPFGHFGETAIREWFRNNLGKLSLDGIPLTSRCSVIYVILRGMHRYSVSSQSCIIWLMKTVCILRMPCLIRL